MSDTSQSTFPNQIDSFDILASLPAEKYADAQELKNLMATTNKNDTQIARMNTLIVELKSYYINPDTWNKFVNCLVAMESFLLNQVDGYIDTKQTEMNTYVDTKKQEVVDSVTNFENSLNSIITQFQDLGDYDPTVDYKVKNMVEFHGSTYINLIPCRDIPPTDETHWKVLATGYVMQGGYDYSATYEKRDLVYFGIEKGIYECINHADIGISPYNTTCWKLLFNVKDLIVEINDYTNNTESLYSVIDNNIVITHNLGDYPMPFVRSLEPAQFGDGGYGENLYGGSGNIYQIRAKAEYPDANNIKILLSESFNGTPTITKISDRIYQVDFSADISLMVKLI